MSKTNIEWTDRRHNVFRGCTRVSPGCENCYAERMSARFGTKPENPYHGIAEFRHGKPRWTGKIEILSDKFDQPKHWKTPSMIFVNTMSDTFHEDIPDDAIIDLFSELSKINWHIYQVLTKRPERMLEFFQKGVLPKQHNFWYGVSVEDQKRCDRLEVFKEIDTPIRWVSAEPLLEDISESIKGHLDNIEWIVCGGESGPYARPMNPEWAYNLFVECCYQEVPYFFKQMGGRKDKGAKELYNPYETTWNTNNQPVKSQYPFDIGHWKETVLTLQG